MLKVLICGTRNKEPTDLLKKIIGLMNKDTLIISGAAPGVDSCASKVAKSLGLTVLEFPADWNKHGRAAGPIRNAQMLEQNPDIVIAIHNDPALGKGTKDMVNRAKAAGVPVIFFKC